MNCKFYLSLFFVIVSVFVVKAQDSYNNLLYKGNKQFDDKKYAESSVDFLEAAKLKKDDFAAHYNLGNALYKQKMYDEAEAEFDKANLLAKNKEDKAAALYNLGNVQMQKQKADKAADLYKQALKNNPQNESIRKNFEIAKLKDKENKEKQKEKGDGKGGGGDNGKDEGDKGDKKNNQPNGAGKQEKGNGEGADQKDSKKENNGNQIPKDIENAILNRVQDKEKETARRILNKNANTMPRSNTKDW